MEIKTHTIEQQANQWADFARQFATHERRFNRFDATKKARQAVATTIRLRAHGLVIPTKLRRVSGFQGALRALQLTGAQYRRLYLKEQGEGWGAQLVAFYGAEPLGYLSPHHQAWIQSLTPEARACLHVYVSAVTGGTADKPMRGCNILIAGVAEAMEALQARV